MSKQYTTSLPDGTAVSWRPLTWGEYRQLTANLNIEEGPAIWHLYDAIAGLCFLDWDSPLVDSNLPKEEQLDDFPAGVITCISEHILERTGFIPTRDLVQKQIDSARGRIQSDYYATGVAYICAAFHYRPHEVDEFTLEEFMNHLAMAEVALGADISLPQEEDNSVQYKEIPDPKTGQILRVPIAKPRGPQSQIDIQDGRHQNQPQPTKRR